MGLKVSHLDEDDLLNPHETLQRQKLGINIDEIVKRIGNDGNSFVGLVQEESESEIDESDYIRDSVITDIEVNPFASRLPNSVR
jgi:hypothetical protein